MEYLPHCTHWSLSFINASVANLSGKREQVLECSASEYIFTTQLKREVLCTHNIQTTKTLYYVKFVLSDLKFLHTVKSVTFFVKNIIMGFSVVKFYIIIFRNLFIVIETPTAVAVLLVILFFLDYLLFSST